MKQNKVILVSIDGMRAKAFASCGHPLVEYLREHGSYTLNGRSVIPPVTLPAHLSIFYSVPPQRHGTLNNTYVSPVRPFDGLIETIKHAGKTSAAFFTWEPLRDITRPDMLTYSEFAFAYSMESADTYLSDRALTCLRDRKPDFLFLHLVETDEKGGHDHGWMSEEYFDRIRIALDNLERIIKEFGDEYAIIMTADHGGHDRIHGMDIPEDMVIPMCFLGDAFEGGKELSDVSLLNLAPTIAAIMGLTAVREWEGKSLV